MCQTYHPWSLFTEQTSQPWSLFTKQTYHPWSYSQTNISTLQPIHKTNISPLELFTEQIYQPWSLFTKQTHHPWSLFTEQTSQPCSLFTKQSPLEPIHRTSLPWSLFTKQAYHPWSLFTEHLNPGAYSQNNISHLEPIHRTNISPMLLGICSPQQELRHLRVELKHTDHHGLVQYACVRTQLALLQPLSKDITTTPGMVRVHCKHASSNPPPTYELTLQHCQDLLWRVACQHLSVFSGYEPFIFYHSHVTTACMISCFGKRQAAMSLLNTWLCNAGFKLLYFYLNLIWHKLLAANQNHVRRN